MNKSTITAVGVFGLLLVAVIATREKNVRVGVKKLDVPSIEKSAITSVELSGAKAAVLGKDGDRWLVADPANAATRYPADDQAVSSLLDAITEFRGTDYISDTKDKHAEYEVDEAKGQRVKVLTSSGPALDLVIGKSAKSGGNYVRKADDDAVFTTRGRLSALARKDVSGWRKRALLSVKADEITALTVTPPEGEAFTVESADGKEWKLKDGTALPEGFRFDSQAAQRLAQALANVRAQEFLDGATGKEPVLGLAGAHTSVEARTKDGKTIKIHVGQGDDPRDLGAAAAIKGAFESLDTNKDGKLPKDELQAAAADAARADDLKKHLNALLEDDTMFQRFDVGAFSKGVDDEALTMQDLEGVSRTAGLVPAILDGDAQVYLLQGYSAKQLSRTLADFRDLSLTTGVTAEKVSQLTINAGGKKIVAVKENGTWKITEPKALPAGFEFDPNQVAMQINMLRNVRGGRIVDAPPKDTGLARPEATVEFKLDDGTTQSIRFGKATTGPTGAKEVFASGSADDKVYAVPEYQRKRLDSGVELFKKPTPPPNMGMGMGGGMNGLDQLPPDIRKKLEAQLRAQGH